ncbi:unnamed protein product, partial [Prorocentrum cordatum]
GISVGGGRWGGGACGRGAGGWGAAMAPGDGAQFRVCRQADVRQALSSSSAVLHSAQVGKLVRLLGAAVELEDGGRRVPLAPRGWIDADALEPVQADGLGGGAPARPGSPLGGAPGGAPARPGSPP